MPRLKETQSGQTGLSRRSFAALLGAGLAEAAVWGHPEWNAALAARSASARPLILNSNENPYGPSAAVLRAMQSALARAHRYPDDSEERLRQAIAASHQVDSNNVLLGCGSSELLRMAAGAFGGALGTVLTAHPTFEALEHYSEAFKARVEHVLLDVRFRHDLQAFKRRIPPQGALVYLCNPNNPTGTFVGGQDVEEFVRAVRPPSIVIVDEAYHHYVTSAEYASTAPLAGRHDHVVVLRTFSKVHGLAGLRVGYALAAKTLCERMARFATVNGINVVAAEAALVALAEADRVKQIRQRTQLVKEYLYGELRNMNLNFIPSETNFVMFDLGEDVEALIDFLAKRSIFTGRPFPPLTRMNRVSLGTAAEMRRFVDGVREFRGARSKNLTISD